MKCCVKFVEVRNKKQFVSPWNSNHHKVTGKTPTAITWCLLCLPAKTLNHSDLHTIWVDRKYKALFYPDSLSPFLGFVSVKYWWWWLWMFPGFKLHPTWRVFWETTFSQRTLCLNTLWVQPVAAILESSLSEIWPHVFNYLLYLRAIFD